jgi:plastocyanin
VVMTSLFALAFSASGCGGDDEKGKEEATAATTAPVATVKVRESEFKLEPAGPEIARTGVVAFDVSNAGKVDHNLEVEAPGGEVELPKNIKPGGSATLRVDLKEAGSYEWYCPVGNHKDLGMKGVITVSAGTSTEGGGSTTPQQDERPGSGGY